MNERPWQSNLWRSIDETPHVAPQASVAAYLMFKDGHVIRGALFQGSYKGCTGTFAGTKDLQVLPGVVKWQPVLGQAAVMAPTPESKVNIEPPKEDELPIDEQIYNDLEYNLFWKEMSSAPVELDTVWILTTHGRVEKAHPYRDDKNRLFWGPDEGCRLMAVAWALPHGDGWDDDTVPPVPKRKTGKWPGDVKELVASAPIVYEDLDLTSTGTDWYPTYTLVGRPRRIAPDWVLTADGQVLVGTYEGEILGWHVGPRQPLSNVIAYSPAVRKGMLKIGRKPERPPLQAGHWPTEEQVANEDVPVTTVIDGERDLHLALPNGPWRHMSSLPSRLEEDDEALDTESVWVLHLDGSVAEATAELRPLRYLTWRFAEERNDRKSVAWAPAVRGVPRPDKPLLYHGASRDPVTWEALKSPRTSGYSNLKGRGAEKPDRLQWLADFLHDIVPGLSAAFSKKADEEPVRLCAHPLTIPAFSCEDYVKRPTVKEIAETAETARRADPEPVEKSPVDSRDWTDGMYKTADDYKVPHILESKCDSTREFHEGIVRGILRDLISKETRDLTLTEYWDQMTPTEAYIMRGLLLGQEHFVDSHNPAATDYNRLYQSGFTTKVMVNFGPRLSRPYSFYGGSGAGGKGEIITGGGGGGGYHQYLWVLTDLGRQFMSYLVAREHRAAVAKIPRP